jgi:2-oxoglutarate dehydrogenase E2 component (dihydrolipoamide succinyltransferase)
LTKGDVLSHIAGETPRAATAASAAPAAPSARPLQAGERRVPMSLLRAKIAERLVQAQHTAAILTTFNEVDLKAVMDLRAKYKDAFKKKYNVGLGFMSFFTKACCIALKEIPEINAYVEGKDILYHDYYHVGVAVGTDRGLVVPVLRNADQLTFAGIEQGILDLAVKARDGKLSIADMSNGTFTISNGGVYGSMLSTPILNAPQSGILGMHNIMQRPVVIDGKIEIRPMMYLALSYDHRVVDGKGAVTFLVRVRECLENPESLGLDFKNEL